MRGVPSVWQCAYMILYFIILLSSLCKREYSPDWGDAYMSDLPTPLRADMCSLRWEMCLMHDVAPAVFLVIIISHSAPSYYITCLSQSPQLRRWNVSLPHYLRTCLTLITANWQGYAIYYLIVPISYLNWIEWMYIASVLPVPTREVKNCNTVTCHACRMSRLRRFLLG